MGKEVLDDLGDGENAQRHAHAEGQQQADVVEDEGEIARHKAVHTAGDQVQDGVVVAQHHQHHAAGHAGDDHGGAGDEAQSRQQNGGAGGEGEGLDRLVAALQQGHAHAEGQQGDEADGLAGRHALAGLFGVAVLKAHPQDGQAAQDEAHEGEAGGQGVLGQQVAQSVAEGHNAHAHAHAQGQQGENALLEVLEQAAHRADDLVVHAHGHRHGAAGHAGDDVCHTDDHAAQNLIDQFHSL